MLVEILSARVILPGILIWATSDVVKIVVCPRFSQYNQLVTRLVPTHYSTFFGLIRGLDAKKCVLLFTGSCPPAAGTEASRLAN